MIQALLRWMKLIGPRDKLVRIKSLRPWFGPHGIEWPVLLVDGPWGRMTIVPVLNSSWMLAVMRISWLADKIIP